MQLGPVMVLVSGPLVGGAVSDPDNEIATLVAVEPDDVKLVDELFMRIFNRPATEAEIESGVAMIHGIPQEHQKLVVELIETQRSLAPKIAEQNRRRQAAIAVAKGELAAYEKEIAPREAELDRQQQQLIAQFEARLKAHEQTLPEKLAAREKRDDRVTQWKPLDPPNCRPPVPRRSPSRKTCPYWPPTPTAWAPTNSSPGPTWSESPAFAWKC